MKLIYSGKGYRQKDHETPTGGDTYKHSVTDDLELFLEDIQLRNKPLPLAWTYFLPELTLKEMELVENKDQEYFRTFKLLNNADVNETEMNLSSATSKYVCAYCRRKTLAIESKKNPNTHQESNSIHKENSIPTLDVNVISSSRILESMSIIEGESLLGQRNTPIRMSNAQSTNKTLHQKLIKREVYLIGIILMLVIGISFVLLSIFTKTPGVIESDLILSTQDPLNVSIVSTSQTSRVEESVLILSTQDSSNVPIVITSAGESHFSLFNVRY